MAALEARLNGLRQLYGDLLLTVLTVLLLILLFVISPLQASGIIAVQPIGFVVGWR